MIKENENKNAYLSYIRHDKNIDNIYFISLRSRGSSYHFSMSHNALVTGAARGIGRAIALRLARDGLNVAVNDINANSTELNDTQKQIEKIGRKSFAITADVSSDKAVETMVQNTAKELGSLDVGYD